MIVVSMWNIVIVGELILEVILKTQRNGQYKYKDFLWDYQMLSRDTAMTFHGIDVRSACSFKTQ
jgi:hypothetical protein